MNNSKFILLLSVIFLVNCAPRNGDNLRTNPEFIKLLKEFRKVESKLSKRDIQTVTTLGLIAGSLQTERAMKNRTNQMVFDLIMGMDVNDRDQMMPKLLKIEHEIERDRRAIEILGKTLDLASRRLSQEEYRQEMKKILKAYNLNTKKSWKSRNQDLELKLKHVRSDILEHVKSMQQTVANKTKTATNFVKQRMSLERLGRNLSRRSDTDENIFMPRLIIIPGRTNGFRRRQDGEIVKSEGNTTDGKKLPITDNFDVEIIPEFEIVEISSEKPEQKSDEKSEPKSEEKSEQQMEEKPADDDSSTDSESGGNQSGGGILGVLSGIFRPDGGIDVGALVGAVTGIVMNLFGPGGLDIPTLLSSGSALLSGLLAGDRNFGTVLGEYAGDTIDGFSGGGGAINNGQFFGNFLGTFLAQLSADPEDDDKPPQPKLFIENFFNSFVNAKKRSGMSSQEEDQKGDDHMGSDSFGFVTKVVRSIVGGVTSVIANSFLGVLGGLSDGSIAASGASSHSSHPESTPCPPTTYY